MAKNENLKNAKEAKNDEFYTQLSDISKELCNYKKHFENKVVFCNCDDPDWSNFWIYFHLNFSDLKLKKLIATHYDKDGNPSYLMEYEGGNDSDSKCWSQRHLKGNGDFRSEECVELLKQADIVVTNPPFSLFREYVAQLMEHEKKFLIIGNKNAITYKEFFPLLKDNKVWIGYNSPTEFTLPDGTITKKISGLTRWFTNLDIKKRHKSLIDTLTKSYELHIDEYEKYDNYDAINVDRVKDIPEDYFGVMGVPITYMDNHNPDEFEILGLLQSSTDQQAGIPNKRYYNDFKEMTQDNEYTGASGGKANGNPVLKGKSEKGNFLYNKKTEEYVHSIYARIVIKRKEKSKNENN